MKLVVDYCETEKLIRVEEAPNQAAIKIGTNVLKPTITSARDRRFNLNGLSLSLMPSQKAPTGEALARGSVTLCQASPMGK